MNTKLNLKMKQLKLSQCELARQMHIKPTTINRAYKQGIKTVRLAELYATHLHCHPGDLLEFKTTYRA